MVSFKPYYKWITFNTLGSKAQIHRQAVYFVLNLIINGLPSILLGNILAVDIDEVLNLIINGLPSILIGDK